MDKYKNEARLIGVDYASNISEIPNTLADVQTLLGKNWKAEHRLSLNGCENYMAAYKYLCNHPEINHPQRLKSALKRLIKDNSHKLFLCCLFVIIGTFAALFLANLINDAFTHRNLSERNYLNIFSLIDGAFSDEQPRKLFWIFETMAALVCFVYFFSSLKPYQAEMYQVTPKIEIPKPYGQKQHGSAWFMPDDEKARIFVNMPNVSYTDLNGDKKYVDTAFPTTKEMRDEISNVVIGAYSTLMKQLRANANSNTADNTQDFNAPSFDEPER